MTKISTWTALQNPVFRKLWLASLISGTCVAAHDTAATWMMNKLMPSPFLISLMSTVASLPFFLLTLPAGALADRVDRKKLLCLINLWLALAAAGLAILGWLHLLNPGVILAGVFLIGVGFAFNAPAWISLVPQIVSKSDLPAAVTLSGLQLTYRELSAPLWGRSLDSGSRSELCFYSKCRLLSRGHHGDPPVEASYWPSNASAGEFFRIARDGHSLCSLRARSADRIGAKCPFCIFHFSDPGADARCRLDDTAPRSMPSWTFVCKYGGRVSYRGCVRHSMDKSPVLFKYPHFAGKSASCVGLRFYGTCSPGRAFPGGRGVGRSWMDPGCFRTLGSGPMRYAKLGTWPPEAPP